MKSIITLVFAFISFLINAQDSLKHNYSLAADVSPYAFKGYSLKAGILSKKEKPFEFQLEAFSMQIPEAVIHLNSKNKDKGWAENVNLGVAFYTDKKLGSKRSAFWAGGGLVYLNQTAENAQEVNEYDQLEYLLRISYKWFPWGNQGFYINPYFALAGRHKIAGSNGAYALSPLMAIPSVYLSWQF